MGASAGVMEFHKLRFVCARRARKIRKRGVPVEFSHWSPCGKARYKWKWGGMILFPVATPNQGWNNNG